MAQGQREETQNNHPDPAVNAPEQVTFRAVALGILTVLVMGLFITYYGFNLIKNYMPVAALLPLVGWVVINSALKAFAPGVALSRTEMLTVFWVAWRTRFARWCCHFSIDRFSWGRPRGWSASSTVA